jgi:hypothetical protein
MTWTKRGQKLSETEHNEPVRMPLQYCSNLLHLFYHEVLFRHQILPAKDWSKRRCRHFTPFADTAVRDYIVLRNSLLPIKH